MSVHLSAFDDDAQAIAEVAAFGLILPSAPGGARLFTRHRAGTAAHVLPLAELPDALRPPARRVDLVCPLAERFGRANAMADRLIKYGIECLFIAPLPDNLGLFWCGKHGADAFSGGQLRRLEMLVARIAAAREAPEPRDLRLQRLARLDDAERMLPVLAGALDVRDVFPSLSAVASAVLPHDAASIQLFADDDHSHSRVYALNGMPLEAVPDTFATNYAAIFNDNFVYSIHDDLLASPAERERPPARAGMRSALRVPLRGSGRIIGALELSSRGVKTYSENDIAVARRIADYVSLAIAHQRMAEETRRAARLREREHNLQMLDGLLSALAGVLDLREVFERVSVIAAKVLPHDAAAVTTILESEGKLRVHALSGFPDIPESFEMPLPEPQLLVDAWDFRIIDDMPAHPSYATSPTVKAGMQSVLGLPVRFEGRVIAGVNFYSRAKARFTRDDVLIGRRIADHLALALSHQRLAAEARTNAELKARADSLATLDDLLGALGDAAEPGEIIDRASAVARTVIPHDGLAMAVRLPDGVNVRHHASGAVELASAAAIVPAGSGSAAAAREAGWDDDVVEDASLRREPANVAAAAAGFRSILRVPVRLDGALAAAVAFVAREPGAYTSADLVAARRIGERFALSLARQRGADASRRADEADARATRLESRVHTLVEELDARTDRRVVGNSPAWRRVLTQATQVAATETTVLLLGESGTGKEVIARFLHRASPRREGPFVALNCAALPEQLLEAELFGYERGAFTGATQSKPGQLEQAGGGMLFLDEVGEMSPAVQAKFLRVLQEREFQRLGGTRVLRTDARVVAATNRDLQRAMEQGTFREDLFYRLNVFAIHLPPLRDRKDDVLPLSEAFLAEFGRTLGRPPAGISRDARARLLEYDWPGNVRELRNILERAAILCDGGLITAEHLALYDPAPRAAVAAPAPQTPTPTPTAPRPAAEPPAGDIASMERTMIEQALQAARFNKSRAAQALGLTRAQLYVRMRRHGLE